MLVPNSQLQFYKFDYLGNKIKELDVHHNPILLDGIDLLSTFQEVMNHEMSAGTWYTHMSDTSNIKAKIIETKFEIENGLNTIFNKAIGVISAVCLCFILALILYLACNCCVKCCPYKKLDTRIDKLFKSISHQPKTELSDELETIVVKPIEMVELNTKHSSEDMVVPSNKQVNDSGDDSLDSITNRFIDSTI